MYTYDWFMMMYETITICKVIALQLKKKEKEHIWWRAAPQIYKKKKNKKKKPLLKLKKETSNPIKK